MLVEEKSVTAVIILLIKKSNGQNKDTQTEAGLFVTKTLNVAHRVQPEATVQGVKRRKTNSINLEPQNLHFYSRDLTLRQNLTIAAD